MFKERVGWSWKSSLLPSWLLLIQYKLIKKSTYQDSYNHRGNQLMLPSTAASSNTVELERFEKLIIYFYNYNVVIK